MTQTVSGVRKEAAFVALGGVVAYGGFLAILAAAIFGLAEIGLAWWLSALIVGLLAAGFGYTMVQKGLQALKGVDLAPRHTMQTFKEDARWAKRQMR
jgi:hypothetical protein